MEVEAVPKKKVAKSLHKRHQTASKPVQHHHHKTHVAKVAPATIQERTVAATPVPKHAAPAIKPVVHAHSQLHFTPKTTSTQAENIISDGISESPEIDKAESKFDDFANAADKFDSDDKTSKPNSLVQKASDDLVAGDTDSQIAKIMKKND